MKMEGWVMQEGRAQWRRSWLHIKQRNGGQEKRVDRGWSGCKSRDSRRWCFVGLCCMLLKVTDVVFNKYVSEHLQLNQFHGAEDDDNPVKLKNVGLLIHSLINSFFLFSHEARRAHFHQNKSHSLFPFSQVSLG